MTLRQTMRRHAREILTRLDHLGELVTYRFKSGAPDREIRAVVNRLDIEPASGNATQVGRLRAIVEIPRDANVGVETVAPGDRMLLAMRMGGETLTCRIRRIVSQDDGTFALEVEA
jgi:hypothetical protein